MINIIFFNTQLYLTLRIHLFGIYFFKNTNLLSNIILFYLYFTFSTLSFLSLIYLFIFFCIYYLVKTHGNQTEPHWCFHFPIWLVGFSVICYFCSYGKTAVLTWKQQGTHRQQRRNLGQPQNHQNSSKEVQHLKGNPFDEKSSFCSLEELHILIVIFEWISYSEWILNDMIFKVPKMITIAVLHFLSCMLIFKYFCLDKENNFSGNTQKSTKAILICGLDTVIEDIHIML